MTTGKSVPVLVTLDCHPVPGMADYLVETVSTFDALDIKATFFITASVLEENPWLAQKILDAGHEIGSHGLFHNDQPFNGYPAERYDLLDEPMQRRFIEEATDKFEQCLGKKVTSFRSPCFGLSGPTMRLLEEYGYEADVSVSSQRLDFLTSNPFSFNHLLAPRLPYHPSFTNPFRKGDSRIWEIPVSSFIVPYAVMTLITFRLALTRLFFSALRRESSRTGKPIVYMVHPEEFCRDGSTYTIPMKALGWRDFLPRKGSGIRARQALRMSDPAKIHDCNESLMKHMKSFEDLRFVTVHEYVESWLEGDRGDP